MKAVGDRLFVDYDMTHNKVFNIGSINLVRPDMYIFKDGESDNKMEGRVNKLELNPQVATVELTNEKHNLFKGDKVFLHYLAYEWLDPNDYTEIDGKKLYSIDARDIFFKIKEDNEIELKDDLFLGEVILEDTITVSGIYINVENKRKEALVTITHIPSARKEEVKHIKVGDVVKSIDDYQYILNFNNKKYVLLKSDEIVAII